MLKDKIKEYGKILILILIFYYVVGTVLTIISFINGIVIAYYLYICNMYNERTNSIEKIIEEVMQNPRKILITIKNDILYRINGMYHTHKFMDDMEMYMNDMNYNGDMYINYEYIYNNNKESLFLLIKQMTNIYYAHKYKKNNNVIKSLIKYYSKEDFKLLYYSNKEHIKNVLIIGIYKLSNENMKRLTELCSAEYYECKKIFKYGKECLNENCKIIIDKLSTKMTRKKVLMYGKEFNRVIIAKIIKNKPNLTKYMVRSGIIMLEHMKLGYVDCFNYHKTSPLLQEMTENGLIQESKALLKKNKNKIKEIYYVPDELIDYCLEIMPEKHKFEFLISQKKEDKIKEYLQIENIKKHLKYSNEYKELHGYICRDKACMICTDICKTYYKFIECSHVFAICDACHKTIDKYKCYVCRKESNLKSVYVL